MARRSPLICVLNLLAFLLVPWLLTSHGFAASLPLGSQVASLNGVRLWYKVAGAPVPGQAPLLFLHGGPGYDSYSFEKTIGAALQQHAQVIYLDERGSGRSERPKNGRYDLPTMAADVEALRRHLDVPQLSVMGHSFGGTIALEYAARYPERVQKLIIVDGAADMPVIFDLWGEDIAERYPAAWAKVMAEPEGTALRQAHAGGNLCATSKAEFAAEMAALSQVDADGFHHWQQFHALKYLKEQEALDAQSGLKNTGEIGSYYFGPQSDFPCYRFTAYDRIVAPVLVIVGKYDHAVGVAQMEALARHLPNARFDEFGDSAHFPYAEQPEKFVTDVANFLAGK